MWKGSIDSLYICEKIPRNTVRYSSGLLSAKGGYHIISYHRLLALFVGRVSSFVFVFLFLTGIFSLEISRDRLTCRCSPIDFQK